MKNAISKEVIITKTASKSVHKGERKKQKNKKEKKRSKWYEVMGSFIIIYSTLRAS